MSRLRFLGRGIVALFLPIAIFFLSSNIIMRISETYIYHFNDSEVVGLSGVDISGAEFARSIAGYFNSFGGEFQVYEQNGKYRDPLFEENEVRMMASAKRTMSTELLGGIVLMGIGIFCYIWLYRAGDREGLRRAGFLGMAIGIGLLVLQILLLNTVQVRAWLYDTFIGVELSENSLIAILLRSPFEKSYLLFHSILGTAMLSAFTYAHHLITKENRIFS